MPPHLLPLIAEELPRLPTGQSGEAGDREQLLGHEGENVERAASVLPYPERGLPKITSPLVDHREPPSTERKMATNRPCSHARPLLRRFRRRAVGRAAGAFDNSPRMNARSSSSLSGRRETRSTSGWRRISRSNRARRVDASRPSSECPSACRSHRSLDRLSRTPSRVRYQGWQSGREGLTR